ncbi:NAD-glutamate dehydrogenase [Motiliproteus sediminis]|uniref:NAD-glutamate dehydrogenase n=1 Tax=Motiliproteus sediminis TaxID=1468178 RepID=UPI001AEFC0DC|nr:NAD-glutamate dehydrogenase [Motiliproteus sediminis]
MFDSRSSVKQKLLSKLSELFTTKLETQIAEELSRFARLYYHVTPVDELAERRLENLYGATLSCWHFLQQRSDGSPKVRVFNPDVEQHGWHSNHTVIEILNGDMPFLVDSVRMELNRQGLSIHAIHNAIIAVERDAKGQLLGVFDSSAAAGKARESAIYLEVDRRSDRDELKAIESDLLDVLGDVRAAVTDYPTMQQRVQEAAERLTHLPAAIDAEQAAEARAFLEWLLADNFTFLAYDEVELSGSGDELALARIKDSELGTLRVRGNKGKGRKALQGLRDNERVFIQTTDPVMFGKDGFRSRVHRPVYRDLVVVKRYDDSGSVIGEQRFYGLYTSPVFAVSPRTIPLLRRKVAWVVEQAGFEPGGHSSKELAQVIKDLPREELFLTPAAALFETAMGIFNLQERRKVRLFVRPDPCGKFFSCLYYAPRDIYSTDLRGRVQRLLEQQFGALDTEFTTHFSESVLARTHFVLRVDPDQPTDWDLANLQAQVVETSRAWDEELHHALIDRCGEEQGNRYATLYRGAFPSAYREHFTPSNAVYDVQRLAEIEAGQPVAMSFYRMLEESSDLLRFKLLCEGEPLILSDIIPVLENLGMRVVGEHPYEVRRSDGREFWLHDFTLSYYSSEPVELQEVKQLFQDAFAAIWDGQAENDEFNRLVVGGKLSWREVALLRAYTRYNRQLRFDYSQPYIADTLARHLQVTKLLVGLFRARFEPARQSSDKVDALAKRLEASVADAIEQVDNLNDDRILRRLLELIKATLRTNYFQCDGDGGFKPYMSFKLNPREIANIPRPRPMFETFVYSPRVEGVHLRGGKVARGGLRWSDRLEDFRTEVLGLVKAQQVKNAVIVPVGAKGGFVAKCLPEGGSRDEIQAEGIACYQTFIRGLLDLADNLVGGEVVPPRDVIRHDDDDPYLVVAADKGTATFSDIANALAEEYGFWLGDAFASGGSQGYDHKGMGITAKGAWESVKRHFRERGLDTQTEPFTVVGIGDMGGDVFGNGMLLSEQIRLVAAFNHLHIFIDPEPDTAASFAERQRLFALPRSSWADYDAKLISRGGGVFDRSAKSIKISAAMKQRFAIEADSLSPNELISALLQAPVDLLWNGGIGTYVKASSESHADVGDKANDSLRINGNQLRCKVLGEGGNLGFTQLGRIEFAKIGGSCNTDFIDNAGGVDCSDHEVNIKILLNEVVANGDMTVKQRNRLLKDMTDDVSRLVLRNNYSQVQALSIAREHAERDPEEYIRLIHSLEADGKLDRELEYLPGDDELQSRKQLTTPELSVLISYIKAELKEALVSPRIYADPVIAAEVRGAFPARISSDFPEAVAGHRLRAEIIANQLANGMVNRMGITYPHVVRQASGADYDEVAVAYVIARDVFAMDDSWSQVEQLDGQVDVALQRQIMAELQRLIRRASYWFLRNHRYELEPARCIARYRAGIAELAPHIGTLVQGSRREDWQNKRDAMQAQGVSEPLAELAASADSLFSLLGIIQVAEQTGKPLTQVAEVYFGLGDRLQLHWFDQQVRGYEARNHWQSLACDSYRDDLNSQQRLLTKRVLQSELEAADDAERVSRWLEQYALPAARWGQMLEEIRATKVRDCAIFSVALRELMDLSQAALPG